MTQPCGWLVPCSVPLFRPAWAGLLGLAGLAGNATCQGPCAETPFVGGNLVCLPEGLAGDYGETLSGDLNGDQTPEVALLRGTNLIVVHGAAIGNDSVALANDALAVAHAPAGPASGGQKLFYTSAAGLSCATFVQDHYEMHFVLGGLWQGAVEVHYDAQQGALLGVDGTQKQILRSTLAAGVVGAPVVLFTLTQTVRDMRLIDWDGLGIRELALQLSTGVQVRRQDRTLLASKSAVFLDDPWDAIAVVHRAQGSDTLAWLTRLADEKSYLQLLDVNYGAPFLRGPYYLGPGVYLMLSAGELDGDGRDDLVVSTATGAAVWVIDDLSTVETWPPQAIVMSRVFLWDDYVAGAGDPLPGAVLCANFFNDHGAPPAAHPLAGIARVLPALGALRLMRAPCEGCLYQTNDFHSAELDTQGPRTWRLRLGSGWSEITGANQIQLVVRRYPENASEPDQYPVHSGYTDFTGPIGANVVVQFETTDQEDATSYFAQVRPVHRGPGGTIDQVWRWSILSVTADCVSLAWLGTCPGAFEQDTNCCLLLPFPVVCTTPQCSPFPGPYIPSAVPQSRIPNSGNVLPGNPPN